MWYPNTKWGVKKKKCWPSWSIYFSIYSRKKEELFECFDELPSFQALSEESECVTTGATHTQTGLPTARFQDNSVVLAAPHRKGPLLSILLTEITFKLSGSAYFLYAIIKSICFGLTLSSLKDIAGKKAHGTEKRSPLGLSWGSLDTLVVECYPYRPDLFSVFSKI